MRWYIWKYIFQTLEAIFPYKGVFFTKVVKANIIAFIKTNILRPAFSVKNPLSKNVSPRCIVHWVFSWATHNQDSTAPQNDKWHKKFSCLVSEKTGTISKDENYGRPIDAVYTFSCLREHFPNKKCILSSMTQNGWVGGRPLPKWQDYYMLNGQVWKKKLYKLPKRGEGRGNSGDAEREHFFSREVIPWEDYQK